MRHHVQIFEPAGLPIMLHGIFYERELRRFQVCPYVDGKLLSPLPMSKGDGMADMARSLLMKAEEASVSDPTRRA